MKPGNTGMWMVVLGLMVVTASPVGAAELTPSPEELTSLVTAADGTRYFGCYFAGKKAGWQVETWSSTQDHFCVESELYMVVAVMGATSTNRTTSKACYQAIAPFLLDQYSLRQEEDGNVVEARGRRQGAELHYTLDSAGNQRTLKVPASQETLTAAIPWAAFKRMNPGDSVTTVSFDALTAKNRTTRVVMKEAQERVVRGGKLKLFHIQVAEEGTLSLDGYLGPDGQLLEATFGTVFRITAEDPSTAKDLSSGPVDLFRSMFVAGKGSIDDALVPRAKVLTVRLSGESPLNLPPLHRQEITTQGETWATFTVSACPEANLEPPLPEDTVCSADVPCDLAEVRTIALEAAGAASTPLTQALALSGWVHANFKYTVGGTSGPADALLKRRTGDCSEFSKVYVLLARALGIPAREVTGIVLAETNPLTFGYHAWAQVFLPDTGWTDLDPTWGHFPVDATHIALGVREDLSSIIHLGSLSIEVLDVSYSDGPLSCP